MKKKIITIMSYNLTSKNKNTIKVTEEIHTKIYEIFIDGTIFESSTKMQSSSSLTNVRADAMPSHDISSHASNPSIEFVVSPEISRADFSVTLEIC